VLYVLFLSFMDRDHREEESNLSWGTWNWSLIIYKSTCFVLFLTFITTNSYFINQNQPKIS